MSEVTESGECVKCDILCEGNLNVKPPEEEETGSLTSNTEVMDHKDIMIKELNSQLERYTALNLRYEKVYLSVSDENNVLKGEIDSHQKNTKKKDDLLRDLKKKNEEDKKNIKDLIKKISSLEKMSEKQLLEFKNLRESYDALNDLYKKANEDSSSFNKFLPQVITFCKFPGESKWQDVVNLLKQRQVERQQFIDTYRILQTTHDEVKNQNQFLSRDLEIFKNKSEEYYSNIKSLNSQLEYQEQVINGMEARLNQYSHSDLLMNSILCEHHTIIQENYEKSLSNSFLRSKMISLREIVLQEQANVKYLSSCLDEKERKELNDSLKIHNLEQNIRLFIEEIIPDLCALNTILSLFNSHRIKELITNQKIVQDSILSKDEELGRLLEELDSEKRRFQLFKKKNITLIKELQRQLGDKNEMVPSPNENSSHSSCLDAIGGSDCSIVTDGYATERLAELVKMRDSEIRALRQDVHTLTSELNHKNKLCERLFSINCSTGSPSPDLSNMNSESLLFWNKSYLDQFDSVLLESNVKLKLLLEETLFKNSVLLDNVATLGEEIQRLKNLKLQ